ncbi:hypothetical protein UY3_07167 [Chelonia mydas]|uniref:Uncharacterized protein n=1 Tax=Chelonia mydas TaxID=8469 RepID=M7C578_CHEMY|nr:hypothetical protein UY3_07167 [Chelonia mydas]
MGGSYWLPLWEQRRLGVEQQLQTGAPAGEEGTLQLPAPGHQPEQQLPHTAWCNGKNSSQHISQPTNTEPAQFGVILNNLQMTRKCNEQIFVFRNERHLDFNLQNGINDKGHARQFAWKEEAKVSDWILYMPAREQMKGESDNMEGKPLAGRAGLFSCAAATGSSDRPNLRTRQESAKKFAENMFLILATELRLITHLPTFVRMKLLLI